MSRGLIAPKGWAPVTCELTFVSALNGQPIPRHDGGLVSSRCPGLAVTCAQGSLFGAGWRITHLTSGYALPGCYNSPVAACQTAARLAPIGDWARPAAELLVDAVFLAAVRAVLCPTPSTVGVHS